MGSFIEKMKNAYRYCVEHHFRQLLLYNVFQNISRFQAMRVKNVYLYPFWRTDLDKMTYQKSQNRRYFEIGSDVTKRKKV